ncbi:MAG: cation diffusion facilitator family transporter [Clostridiales Family XIII bacterium]|nr:cation diffusion facilitator family transporter [Clostridiales Family XIII bacterium]
MIKLFIKNPNLVDNADVRKGYGNLAGIVGIVTNILLSCAKAIAAYLTGSIAVIGDALNNLMDAAASVITLIGFRLASKGRDKEHPFGHARIEYMTGVLIAFLILYVGLKLLTSSVQKILHPEVLDENLLTVFLLVGAILVKFWQCLFYYSLARRIRSGALRATGADSRNDCITTAAVLVSLILYHFVGINFDGIMGSLVALFVLYSGIKMLFETARPLLGQAPDEELVKNIEKLILEKSGILGLHDLVVHDYGPGRVFASVHIEVDSSENVLVSHEYIDEIEKEAMQRLNVELVGHLDPIDTTNPLLSELRDFLTNLCLLRDDVRGVHDLRLVYGARHINVIFDVVLTEGGEKNRQEIFAFFGNALQKEDARYFPIIAFDLDYS